METSSQRGTDKNTGQIERSCQYQPMSERQQQNKGMEDKRRLDNGWYRIRRYKGEDVPCPGTVGLWKEAHAGVVEQFRTDIDPVKMDLPTAHRLVGAVLQVLGWTEQLQQRYSDEFESTWEATERLVLNAQDLCARRRAPGQRGAGPPSDSV